MSLAMTASVVLHLGPRNVTTITVVVGVTEAHPQTGA